ncbi:MAG TPA: c-type cytochrome [Sneathiellales bacterium]|nr:c-type cytochrome [Sneathiellales bacterium]
MRTDKKTTTTCFLLVLTMLFGFMANAHAADLAAGKKVAKSSCKQCHAFVAGKNKIGPTLFGIIGRVAGTAEGYKFKPDMIAAGKKGLVWDKETFSKYMVMSNNKRKKYIGSLIGKSKASLKMNAKKIKGKKLENLLGYLETLK